MNNCAGLVIQSDPTCKHVNAAQRVVEVITQRWEGIGLKLPSRLAEAVKTLGETLQGLKTEFVTSWNTSLRKHTTCMSHALGIRTSAQLTCMLGQAMLVSLWTEDDLAGAYSYYKRTFVDSIDQPLGAIEEPEAPQEIDIDLSSRTLMGVFKQVWKVFCLWGEHRPSMC